MNSSTRKFAKVTYTLTLICELDDLNEAEVEDTLSEMGFYSWASCDYTSEVQEITPLEAARALIDQRSEPEFLGLNELGDDVMDEVEPEVEF